MTIESLRRQFPLRAHVVMLFLGAVIPILIFAIGSLFILTFQQTENIRLGLKSTTRALSSAVDAQVNSVISTLRIFGEVENLSKKTISDLHFRTSRFIQRQTTWKAILLLNAKGDIIFRSRVPVGTALPSRSDNPSFQKAMATQKPVVSSIHEDYLSGERVISVFVPMYLANGEKYVLLGSINADTFSNLLYEQNLNRGWTVGLLDSDSTIIARSRSPGKYVGKKATSNLASISRSKTEDFFEDVTQEGRKTFGLFKRLDAVDWTLVLGIPTDTIQLPFWRTLSFLLTGGLILLGLGLLMARFIGRRISIPITSLAGSANLLSQGEIPKPVHSSILEVNKVSEALVQAAKELSEERKLRDNFLSVASHDLKSPVATINFQCQALEMEIESGSISEESLRQATSRIRYHTEKVIALVDELLDISRITAGHLKIEHEELELVEFIKEITTQFESESKRTGSVIKIHADSPIKGYWDGLRLHQIFTNLISNAIKYGKGNPVEVYIRTAVPDVIIEIRDQGIGIAPEDQTRIFKRFERAVNSGNVKGLGLGLWIVQLILNALDGDIRVDSEPGRGSTFTVRIPIRPRSFVENKNARLDG